MSFSNELEVDILKAITGQATTVLSTTPLSDVYIGLFTGTLAGDTPGTEVPATNGYGRVSTTGKWAVPSAGSVSNNATITFPTASGNWASGAPVTHVGLFTASTGGTPLGYSALGDPSKTFGANDTAAFPPGSITIQLD